MADPAIAIITPDLLARLEALKEVLASGGIVQYRQEPHRRPTWRLRFRVPGGGGRRRQGSIELKTQELADAVTTLVHAWQQQRRQMKEVLRVQRQAEQDLRCRRRQRRRHLQDLAGGGRRRRDRVGRLYDQAVHQGYLQEMAFCLCGGYLRPEPPRGRPRMSGLVLLG